MSKNSVMIRVHTDFDKALRNIAKRIAEEEKMDRPNLTKASKKIAKKLWVQNDF